jgi:acyl-coenzyme A synthetase/AMP-(fatty) acid ligase
VWELERHGDRPAVVADDGSVELSYRELARRADEFGKVLGEGRRLVLIRAANNVESLLAYVGAMRAGHVVLLAEDKHADALVTAYDPDTVVAPDGAVVHCRPESTHTLHPDLALVLSTSGSTGSPKLVRLSHENLASNAEAIAEYLELTPADRAMTSLPMHYCYGLSVINSHMAAGASLVVTDKSVVDRCFWAAFAERGATNFAGVPYTFDLLDRIGFEGAPGLRFVTQAGGRMAPEQVRKYAAMTRLFVMYGQTEATARMAYLPPESAAAHADCIGVPIPGGSFDIAEDGELVYRGPNVMLGYARAAADLARGRDIDELRTGDVAERTPDGLYRIVGRRSRLVKPFGVRIDLDAVERLVGDAVAVGDDAGVLVACPPRRHAQARAALDLPASALHTVDLTAVPRLSTGKPDYAALQRTLDERRAGAVTAAAGVAELFGRVLGVAPERIGEHDTFVTLGGDSLSYVETSVALEELLGHLPPDWQRVPVGSLVPERARRRAPRMETNVVLRAAAIFMIVASHADLTSLEGGAHALLLVAGFNFARFQLATGRMWRSIARIAVPSVAWIALMAATHAEFGWPNVLLVNGLVERPELNWAYWYVEAVVQILVVLAAVLSVPALRRFERGHSLAVAAAVLGVGLFIRFDAWNWFAVHHRVNRPQHVLWLFALGWCAALAKSTWQRVGLTAVAAWAVHDYFMATNRQGIVLAAAVLLLWAPRLPVPRLLNRAVGTVAAASLAIYLTHWEVYPLLERQSPPLATSAALAVGVLVYVAVLRPARSAPAIGRIGVGWAGVRRSSPPARSYT